MLSELMDKIAKNKPLNALELSQLRNEFRSLEEIKNLAKGWVVPGTQELQVINNMERIYPENGLAISENLASLEISVPQEYNHLMIIGTGKSTSATVDEFWVRFNGDSGSNYNSVFVQTTATTVSGDDTIGADKTSLGRAFETADSTLAASFFCIIPHYKSSFYKAILTTGNLRGAAFQIRVKASWWDSVDPIKSMSIFTDALVKAGTLISVYGFR